MGVFGNDLLLGKRVATCAANFRNNRHKPSIQLGVSPENNPLNQPRIALVTGGNRGIGKEICRQLAQQGHTTILTSRDPEKGKQALREIDQPNYDLRFYQLDVSNPQSIREAYDWVQREFGRLDILVNNAGINYDTWHNALDADLDQCRQTLEVNLFGPWLLSQTFIPLMQRNGYGRVVNVSSGSGQLNGMGGGTPGYSISKAALNVLTVKLASQVQGQNILINAVGPGWVRTDMGGSNATRSVEEGADGIVWAANLPDDGPSGGFFRDGKTIDW